jgi:hypothetical protein
MVGFGVMDSMRVLPGEIRNEQYSMQNETKPVIEEVAIRKGPMTTFVTEHPY